MAAPTPVSAYLHSAAMVAAGVYLLARVYPLLVAAPALLDALVVVGFASMAVGGVLALANDELKRLLAYSTIAQYGYVVVLLGLDPAIGPGAAAFAVVAHAVAKSGLFLTAGAVTEATGEKLLGRVGGLWRSHPVLALASGVCAAGLAALPLTGGFFKDELFFKAALDRGPLVTALALAGAALSFGYAARFWAGIFLGRSGPAETRPLPVLLVAPIAALAIAVLLVGVAPGGLSSLAEAAGAVSTGVRLPVEVAYHLDARPENLLALASFGGGAVLALAASRRGEIGPALADALGRFGPERFYVAMLQGLNHLSDAVHRFEVRDLRSRVAWILMPAGVLMLAGVAATPTAGAYLPGSFSRADVPLLLVLGVAAVAAVAVAVPTNHLAVVLLLSGVGYALTVVFALVGAPDVALVAVLMETLFALLFLGVLAALPRSVLGRLARSRSPTAIRHRDVALGILAGGFAFVAAWGVLSRPAALETVATLQIELTPTAHAGDVVTAILADFRGLDTMGEISVIGVALLGLMTLLRRERAR
jgi:multicomponent Na+:H+ antiporter subunit A